MDDSCSRPLVDAVLLNHTKEGLYNRCRFILWVMLRGIRSGRDVPRPYEKSVALVFVSPQAMALF